LEDSIVSYDTATEGRTFLFATEHVSKMYDIANEDEMWAQVREMVYGSSLVMQYKAACAQAEDPESAIAQECEAFVERRRLTTGQSRKTGEAMRAIVNAMFAN